MEVSDLDSLGKKKRGPKKKKDTKKKEKEGKIVKPRKRKKIVCCFNEQNVAVEFDSMCVLMCFCSLNVQLVKSYFVVLTLGQ